MSSPRTRVAQVTLAVLLFGATAGSAHAQPAPKGPAPTEPAKPDPAKPDKAQLAEAKKHMEAGAAFYNDPSGHKCEEAYREFLKAYELSKSLKALKALGICALVLERDGDAIERFETYLAEKGSQIEAADKAQVESDLKALKTAVAKVTFKSDRKGVRITDVRTPSSGSPVTNDYTIEDEQTLGIHPGRHTFTATVEGAPSLTWSTEITNGGTYEHTFDFAKAAQASGSGGPGDDPNKTKDAPKMERPIPLTVMILGGVTVALAVPTAIFMARASEKNSDYEAKNGSLPATELEGIRADVKTANVVADVFLGATVASLAATGFFYFTRPARPAERAAIVGVAPIVGTSGYGALVQGRF